MPARPTPAPASWRALLPALLAGACADKAGPSTDSGSSSLDGFALSEVVSCEQPLDQPTWTDVGEEQGFVGATISSDHTDGGGIALAELDGDGLLDLMIHFHQEAPQLWYQREDLRFEAGEDFPYACEAGQAAAGDMDGDGLAELVFPGPTSGVFWNRGGDLSEGYRIEVTSSDDRSAGRQAVLTDLDGDGLLDFYLPTTAPEEFRDEELSQLEDHVVVQQADGSFEVVSLGALGRRDAFDGVPFDWGDDGDLDLYVVNDKGTVTGGNVLWGNEGGSMSDATESCSCSMTHSGMGGSAEDLDGDGIIDLFITATDSNHFLQGQADGSFVDVTFSTGASVLERSTDMGWGSVLIDVDNDGLVDIFTGRGDLWYPGSSQPGFESPVDLLLQQPDGSFDNASVDLGLPQEGSWRGLLAWDLNGDGVLDLVLHDVVDRPRLLLSDGCTAASWLAVDAPVGSKVTVHSASGTQVRWPTAHPGYGASQPPRAWFGLGADEQVDSLEVRLASGELRTLTGPIEARRVIGLTAD